MRNPNPERRSCMICLSGLHDGCLSTAIDTFFGCTVSPLRIVKASPVGYEALAVADVLQGAKRPRLLPIHPVLCNSRIYCRNYAGDLVCIDVSK